MVKCFQILTVSPNLVFLYSLLIFATFLLFLWIILYIFFCPCISAQHFFQRRICASKVIFLKMKTKNNVFSPWEHYPYFLSWFNIGVGLCEYASHWNITAEESMQEYMISHSLICAPKYPKIKKIADQKSVSYHFNKLLYSYDTVNSINLCRCFINKTFVIYKLNFIFNKHQSKCSVSGLCLFLFISMFTLGALF